MIGLLRTYRGSLLWAGLTALVLLARANWPPRGLDEVGLVALRDLLLTLLLWLLLLGLALGVGRRVLSQFHGMAAEDGEAGIFALSLGLGVLAYLVLGLALIGWLSQDSITILLFVVSLWAGPALRDLPGSLRAAPMRLALGWRNLGLLPRAIVVGSGLVGSLAFTLALAPPWGFDELTYHLVGPRQMLGAGRIAPVPENWGINSPFTAEMLFTLGMAFGDDIVPRLLHLSFAILLTLAGFAFTRRFIGGNAPYFAAAGLLTSPVLPILASLAYADFAQATFEFLAIFAVLLWVERKSPGLLALAGLFLGLALGTKYNAVSGLAALGFFVLWQSRSSGFRSTLQNALVFGTPALLVASPWYLKNWFWLGNPFYPFYFGGLGWNEVRLTQLMEFTGSYGVGRSVLDYLLLPFNLYARNQAFGALMPELEMPSLLFALAPLAVLPPRRRPVLAGLLIAALLMGFWALGSQQTRFLLPAYPLLAAGTGEVMSRFSSAVNRPKIAGYLMGFLILSLMTVVLILLAGLTLLHRTPLVLLGLESKSEFLRRAETGFAVADYLERRIGPPQRALLIADDRRYYCPTVCQPTPDNWWPHDLVRVSMSGGLCEWLEEHHATHLALNMEVLQYTLRRQDEQGLLRSALDFIQAQESQGLLKRVFTSRWGVVYAATCNASSGTPLQPEVASPSRALLDTDDGLHRPNERLK